MMYTSHKKDVKNIPAAPWIIRLDYIWYIYVDIFGAFVIKLKPIYLVIKSLLSHKEQKKHNGPTECWLM